MINYSGKHTIDTEANRAWPYILSASGAIAVAAFIILYFPDQEDGSGSALGALSALAAAILGLTAAARSRPLPMRSAREHLRLTGFTFALGMGLGLANLGINYGMSVLDQNIYDQMVTRWAEFSTWSVVFSGPIMEEIIFRLFLVSGLAWVVSRFTDNHRTILYIALGLPALVFGLAHIFYGGVDDSLYKAGMAVKSTGAGLLLGWIFWRWGLPYSIICHCLANAIHLLLIPFLF